MPSIRSVIYVNSTKICVEYKENNAKMFDFDAYESMALKAKTFKIDSKGYQYIT